ncbi:hypothetical protein MPER_11787 [Moniliophthora perniciosa FA553]|nr:hypothetical protein MPER_11787 [Moniliophthora perniciosa FA553]
MVSQTPLALLKTTERKPIKYENLFPIRENYTRKAPPVPEDMKDDVCIWGFVITKATLGSCSPNTREESERCQSILKTCDEVGIGSPKAQITYGNGDKFLGLPPVTVSVPSEEKIEELRKKLHLEGEPKWVYRA